MDLKQLQAMGAIVPRTLFKRELAIKRPKLKPQEEWTDLNIGEPDGSGEWIDDTVTVFIRKRSSVDFMELMQAPDRDKAFVAILRCVCHENGAEVFESIEQTKQLGEWLYIPLAIAVNEVNQFDLKNSQPRTKRGMNSRSASAGGQSRNGKRLSRKKSGNAGSSTAPSADH